MSSVISMEEATMQFSGLVDFVNHNKSAVTIVRSGQPVVRITPVLNRRNLEPDALLMGASISDDDLFDDCSADFEELNHE